MKVTPCFLATVGVLLAGCFPGDRECYLIKGSDTEVNLVLTLAEQFMEREGQVSLAVSGGGSGTGIAALINRKTHLANSSRPLKDGELEMARARGVEPMPFVFALDGLAVVVHESNRLSSLSLDEVGSLYRGEHGNWSELGGSERAITLYGRQSNSGTFVYFREKAVRGDYAREVRRMNGTAQIVEAVRHDPSAIGYVGIGYVRREDGSITSGLRVVPIRVGEETISPLEDGVITSGRYPLSRPLYQYTDGLPAGAMRRFLEFEFSGAGQDLVEEQGYFRIPEEHRFRNAELLKGGRP